MLWIYLFLRYWYNKQQTVSMKSNDLIGLYYILTGFVEPY